MFKFKFPEKGTQEKYKNKEIFSYIIFKMFSFCLTFSFSVKKCANNNILYRICISIFVISK